MWWHLVSPKARLNPWLYLDDFTYLLTYETLNKRPPVSFSVSIELIGFHVPQEIPHGTWINDYGYGAGHEIYTEKFASHFCGLRFTDAAM
jgi:Calcium-activated BK potassium channel alpha subunit